MVSLTKTEGGSTLATAGWGGGETRFAPRFEIAETEAALEPVLWFSNDQRTVLASLQIGGQ